MVNTEEKEEKLEKMIFALAKEQVKLEKPDGLNEYFGTLENIYDYAEDGEKFRHYYSKIFAWLSQIDQNYSDGLGSLDILAENIKILRDNYHVSNYKGDRLINIQGQINKLYDHINLEIARMNYLKGFYENSDERISSIGSDINELSSKTAEELGKVDDLSKKVNNAYSEFVSILGVFSAIVLVFFGGTSLLGNALKILNEVSIYKSIVSCAIIGILISDIIFIFFVLLAKILGRDIGNDIYTWETNNFISKMRMRYPIVFFFNIFILTMVVFTIIIWFFPFVVNKIYPQLLNYVRQYLIHSEIRSGAFTIIVLMFLGVNLLFLLSYILSKITDVNIGRSIKIESAPYYYIFADYEESVYILYKAEGRSDKKMGEYDSEKVAQRHLDLNRKKSGLLRSIRNTIRRMTLRYVYMTILNTLLFAISILIIYR